VPTDPSNPGSFDSMAKVPVTTAASGNPVLSTLVSAVTKAGLGDSLNGAQGTTVFAPYNGAFSKIPCGTLSSVLTDQAKLKQILTYHVVQQRISPDHLAGTFKTLEGADLTVAGSGADFTVNGNAKVICGNVQTANATVCIIDTVPLLVMWTPVPHDETLTRIWDVGGGRVTLCGLYGAAAARRRSPGADVGLSTPSLTFNC
jgi:uncharacterized surface protein with fasciclin (FAS1) repeats